MHASPNTIPVITFAEIGSTNAEAMRLGLAGHPAPFWLRAERQSAGRGRSGRVWESKPGNLYASLLVRFSCAPTVVHQLSFVAAVAAADAVTQAARPQTLPLHLKWPNDILIGGAKLCGILPESTIEPGGGVLAVIGVGVNLAHAPEMPGRATTCLAAHGLDVTPAAMGDYLAQAMSASLAEWAEGAGFTAIRSRWLERAHAVGTPITAHAGADVISGTFAGLRHDGALILRDHSGYDRALTYGDVTLDAAPRG
jgi:BirA family transcriptional regulator, biotin operon repressor / biotin---[acetyl-CoA-carboxylase] ligase